MSWKWLLKMDISTSTAYKREFQKIGGSFKQLADTFNLDSGARKCGIDSILTNVIMIHMKKIKMTEIHSTSVRLYLHVFGTFTLCTDF